MTNNQESLHRVSRAEVLPSPIHLSMKPTLDSSLVTREPSFSDNPWAVPKSFIFLIAHSIACLISIFCCFHNTILYSFLVFSSAMVSFFQVDTGCSGAILSLPHFSCDHSAQKIENTYWLLLDKSSLKFLPCQVWPEDHQHQYHLGACYSTLKFSLSYCSSILSFLLKAHHIKPVFLKL